MHAVSHTPTTLDSLDPALPPSADSSANLPPAESEQDALTGGCSGISCGGIKFNHNQTLAEPTDDARDH